MGGGSGAKAPHYISLFPHALFFSLSTRRSSLFTIHYSLSTIHPFTIPGLYKSPLNYYTFGVVKKTIPRGAGNDLHQN
jgi:hypothetical protein